MPKGKELTLYERERIESYLRMKKKKKWIANKLNREYSIIKREIKRNKGEHTPYVAKDAQYYAERRKRNTNKRKLDKWQNESLKNYVIDKLNNGWSPEEIAGRLKNHPPEELKDCKDKTISYESIYDWIYNGEGRFGGLYQNLRRKGSQRRSQFFRKARKNKEIIKERVSIAERPRSIDERKEIGNWETDSVLFKGKSILSVQYERKMVLCRLHKCENKSAIRSEEALQDSIDSLPRNFWLSITRDNGTENALHHKTEVPSYFCDPYCPWQKGGVENLNGLIREYLPKGINLDNISDKEIYLIQERLNNRPRKKLNYLTPNEVISNELKKGL